MIALLVDPYVLVPPSNKDATAWIEYFDRLTAWGTRLRSLDSCTSAYAMAALRAADKYPTIGLIKDTISRLGIDSYSFVDVQNALQVLDKTPYAEDRLCVEVAVEAVLDPEMVAKRLPTEAAEAFKKVIVGSVLANRAHDANPPEVGSCSVVWPEGSEALGELSVRASLSMLEVTGKDLYEIEPAAEVEHELLLHQSPVEPPRAAWEDVCSDPDRAIAFTLAAEAAACGACVADGFVRAGQGLLPSLRACGLLSQPALLRRLYRLGVWAAAGRLASHAGAQLHAVRESAAANAPQVRRANGDALWRCTLTKKGAGFRLHYWHGGSSGTIELDRVMVESEV